MEITGIALQTVSAGEDVAFTETPVCGSKCIVHRQGSGIIKLRGITNQCKARFLVSYSGNIQIPTGGTVEETGEKSELINVIITNGGQVIDICWQFGYTQKQLDTPNYSSSNHFIKKRRGLLT